MHDAATLQGNLTEKKTTDSSWFHSAFDTVAGGFGLFDFIKENRAVNAKLDAGKKESEIDYLLRGAFFDNEILTGEDLQAAVQTAVNAAKEQGELYYGITSNDVLARFAVLSDDHKEILQAAHASTDRDAIRDAWSEQEGTERHENYLGSDQFQEDKQSQLDHLLNFRMGTDLGTLSEDEQAEFIQWHLKSSGMEESHGITVQDVQNEYARTGQKQFEQSTLDV